MSYYQLDKIPGRDREKPVGTTAIMLKILEMVVLAYLLPMLDSLQHLPVDFCSSYFNKEIATAGILVIYTAEQHHFNMHQTRE